MNLRIAASLASVVVVGLCANCSLIASSELKKGIGDPCTGDGDCQGGRCDRGLCSHECTTNEDCPDPSICIGGLCKLGCLDDTACAAGQICEGNACQVGCRQDSACLADEICENLSCQKGCRTDAICGSGKVCINLTCQTGCRTDDGCGTGSICESNACVAGCRKDADCGDPSDGKICSNKACTPGCRDDTWCTAQPGTICNGVTFTCVPGCRKDEDCGKGNICESDACTPGCRNTEGCPDGDYCDNGTCKPTLTVSAVFQGDVDRPAEHAITASHKLGLDEAAASLPFVQFGTDRYMITNNADTADEVDSAITAAVAAGAKVIVTTTNTANARALAAAATNPSVKFLTISSRNNGALDNVGAYSGKTDQFWFAAGRIAARRADSGRKMIGLVLPTPTKRIVRETNAFTRGALSFDPNIKVVIRWLGWTKDVAPSGTPSYSYQAQNYLFDTATDGKLYREELLAAQLADLGCSIIAHRTDTQRVVTFVDTIAVRVNTQKPAGNKDLLSMGVDVKDACRTNVVATGTWIDTCLGVPYFNWGPTYRNLFDELYSDAWQARVVRYEFQTGATALMKFELSPYNTVTGITTTDVAYVMKDAADAGMEAVFEGPYSFNGQRDLNRDGVADTNQTVANGMPVNEEELDRMCWFVQGVYEMPNYQDVNHQTLIPAMVPYGPPVSGQVTTVEASTATKYGDVYTYITTKLSKNPAEVMSCPLSE